MNCKNIYKKLPEYYDNKLSVKEQMEVKAHIDSCTECKLLYKQMVNSIQLLKPTKDIEEKAFYYTRLKQRMENESKKSFINYNSLKKAFQPVFYLASIIFAVYLGILIGSNTDHSNKYSELNDNNKDYIETFAEYNYLNDIEIEPIESLLLLDDTNETNND